MKKKLTFLDLFAGGGGLSEGFLRAGFEPVAHVEYDPAACNTLKTRLAYHYLKSSSALDLYESYLAGSISRECLYSATPQKLITSVIQEEIKKGRLRSIFRRIDQLLSGRRLDLIIGGPPCQAYSIAGRSRDENRMLGDRRNYLYVHYCKFLERYKPDYFVFENVLGLLSAKDTNGSSYLESMIALFRKAGYSTSYEVVSASDYGVLQKRKRVILIGNKFGRSSFFPRLDVWRPEVRVDEIFKDLPKLRAGEGTISPVKLKVYSGRYLVDAGIRNGNSHATFHIARSHNARDLEIYRLAVKMWDNENCRLRYSDLPGKLKTHRNRTAFVDRFKVVSGNLKESHTVVAHIAKDGHYYIHPDIGQNRSLTPREAARLQTFPDDYYFESSRGQPRRSPAFRQIGNAVPVLLSQKIAEKLCENW